MDRSSSFGVIHAVLPGLLVFSLALSGCDCGSAPPSACRTSSQCARGQSCIDGMCVSVPPGTDAGPRSDAFMEMPGCVDLDMDGRGEGCTLGPDCDDTNAERGGAEVCDSVDNDCDGTTDESFAGACGSKCTPDCVVGPRVPGPGGWMPTPENSDGVIVDMDGALTLGRTMAESFSVWVANADEATVSKLDSRTNRELARYPTVGAMAPAGTRPWNEACNWSNQGNCPSRTAVDQNFDAYVANRAFGSQGSLTKYANQEIDCVDRNMNGVIDTSRDLNGDGTIDLRSAEFVGPEDECILWTVPVSNPDGSASPNEVPRALAIGIAPPDAYVGNPWVGHFNTQEACELDAADGHTIRCISIAPIASYGGVADAAGRIWFVDRGRGQPDTLGYVDTGTGVFRMASNAPTVGSCTAGSMYPYGVTVDGDGHVYVAMSSCERIYRYTIATDTWDTYPMPGGGTPRGVAADETSLWVGVSHNGPNFSGGLSSRVLQYNLADMAFVRQWDMPTGRGPVGVGVSFDGSVWAIAQGTSSAARLDPMTGAWVEHGVGLTPYTYSDFIGFGLNTFAQPRGHYQFTSEGCGADSTTRWLGASLRVEVPAGTAVEVYAHTADDPSTFSTVPWVGPFPVTAARPTVDFTMAPGPLPDGRYIEIDVRLRTDDRRVAPRVFSVDVGRACVGIVG
ncbi:MAG: hypothetical protein OHK0013_09610 [Sandaracinaceae bacterium]